MARQGADLQARFNLDGKDLLEIIEIGGMIGGEKEVLMKHRFFFHLSSPFSNFHPSLFEYGGMKFVSNEHFIMYAKARAFGDSTTVGKIEKAASCGLAGRLLRGEVSRKEIIEDIGLSKEWNSEMAAIKKLGREVLGYDDDAWSKRRGKTALFGAKLKFGQDDDLLKILLETDGEVLVEASKWDRVWGIGLSEKDARATHHEKWLGDNLLGKVLGEAREQLKNEMAARSSLRGM